MPEHDFDTRFARQLQDYAQGGVRRIDPVAIAEATIKDGRVPGRGRWSLPAMRRSLQPGVAVLLAILLTAGIAITGAWLLRTPPVTPTLPSPSPDASEEARVGPSTPCAPMLRILTVWQGIDGTGLPPASATRADGQGTLLMTGLAADGSIGVTAIDPTVSPPAPVTSSADPLVMSVNGFPASSQGRFVASPDGRAVAIEEGDPGQAGCGEPIVVTADGRRRPFPVGGFERVSDLAWAPDTSALYGVRRPTIDTDGMPFYDAEQGVVLDGPGSLERWDMRTGAITVLGPGCGTCGALFVSPDGTRIATTDGARIVVRETDGTWTTVMTAEEPFMFGLVGLLGWADDRSVVWADGTQGAQMALDGTVLATWQRPPAHTWTVGPLSPDGSTIAGMTLSDDFLSWQVVLLDVADGSSRVIWSAPDVRGCTAFSEGSTGRAECEAASSIAPGATLDPTTSISGSSRIVAWAPDGSAVVLLEQLPDSTDAIVRIVPTDGSGASSALTARAPSIGPLSPGSRRPNPSRRATTVGARRPAT